MFASMVLAPPAGYLLSPTVTTKSGFQLLTRLATPCSLELPLPKSPITPKVDGAMRSSRRSSLGRDCGWRLERLKTTGERGRTNLNRFHISASSKEALSWTHLGLHRPRVAARHRGAVALLSCGAWPRGKAFEQEKVWGQGAANAPVERKCAGTIWGGQGSGGHAADCQATRARCQQENVTRCCIVVRCRPVGQVIDGCAFQAEPVVGEVVGQVEWSYYGFRFGKR